MKTRDKPLSTNRANCADQSMASERPEPMFDIVIERWFPYPPEAIWERFRTSVLRTQWRPLQGSNSWEPGSRYRVLYLPVVGTGFTGEISGQVQVMEPPDRCVMHCVATTTHGRSMKWNLTFEVVANDHGAGVTFRHSGLRGDDAETAILRRFFTQAWTLDFESFSADVFRNECESYNNE